MRKKNSFLVILLTVIFAIAPFGAVANAGSGNAMYDQVIDLRNQNNVAITPYESAVASDADVIQAYCTGFSKMETLPDDSEGNFTGIKWITKSVGAVAATKYRTMNVVMYMTDNSSGRVYKAVLDETSPSPPAGQVGYTRFIFQKAWLAQSFADQAVYEGLFNASDALNKMNELLETPNMTIQVKPWIVIYHDTTNVGTVDPSEVSGLMRQDSDVDSVAGPVFNSVDVACIHSRYQDIIINKHKAKAVDYSINSSQLTYKGAPGDTIYVPVTVYYNGVVPSAGFDAKTNMAWAWSNNGATARTSGEAVEYDNYYRAFDQIKAGSGLLGGLSKGDSQMPQPSSATQTWTVKLFR